MKINHPLVKGKVKEIKPFVYCVEVDDQYDRSMLFCRYQEFYESPFKQIRGKYFTLEQYMKLYTKKNGKKFFTYPYDWTGYNIPSNVLDKAHDKFYKETEYDEIMNDIYFYCALNAQNKNNGTSHDWYLIGASSKDLKTMDHEIAHGLYFTNKEYRKSTKELIGTIKPTHYNKLKKTLVKMGYVGDKKIIDDEIQAFMSTGLYKEMDTKELKVYEKDFKNNFKKYSK